MKTTSGKISLASKTRRIVFVFILAVMLTLGALLVARHAAGAAELPPDKVALPDEVGESVTVDMPFGVMVEITLESNIKYIDTGDPTNPDDTTMISENTFGTRIKFPLHGWVAWKKLWIRAEWWIGENIVRVLAASSPNIVLKRPDLFYWEPIAQDITSSGWAEGLVRYSAAKLWCDIPFCKDWSYEVECYLYGNTPGLFDCYRQRWE